MIATALTSKVVHGSRSAGEMLYRLDELPVELQRQILDSAEALAPRGGASSEDLLVSLGLSKEEAERLAAVLEIA